jgi:tripartite-type tricarboxylate transporter receptor subunit TctC
MAQPEVRKHLLEQGFEPATTTESEFAQFIRNEIAKWTKVIRAAGIKVDCQTAERS